MLASLKSLNLIHDDKQPTEQFKALIREPENYEKNLRGILKAAYPYLFDGTIDLSNTTTEMVAEKFKTAGASGSTISKGMAFFLSAAKEAGIAVSSRVKPPQAPRGNGTKRRSGKPDGSGGSGDGPGGQEGTDTPPGTEKISFTLRGMPDVTIYFPEGLEDEEEIKRVIRATVFNLEMYYGVRLD